jgi:hypothetical protein
VIVIAWVVVIATVVVIAAGIDAVTIARSLYANEAVRPPRPLDAPFWYRLLDRVGTLRNTGRNPSEPA